MSTANSKKSKIPEHLDRGAACLPCRKKKMRCDGGRPTCSSCLRSYSPKECHYPGAKSTTTVDLLGRIQDLEDRIALLETTSQYPQTASATVENVYFNLHPFGSKFPPTNPMLPGERRIGKQTPSEWLSEDPPEELKNILIGIFIRYHRALGFTISLARFLRALSLPPTDAHAPHPCLLYAVYLSACSFSVAEHGRYEAFLLQRVQENMRDSLAMADRMIHYIVAGVLVTRWYSRKGRFLEAYHEAASTSQFAIACKLNEVSSLMLSEFPSSIAGVPRDTVELGEWVGAFWQIVMLERKLALMRGFPSSLRNENMATMMPRLLAEFSDGRVFFQPASDDILPAINDSTLALEVKSTILFDRASRVAYTIQSTVDAPSDETERTEYTALKHTLIAFIAGLPPWNYVPSTSALISTSGLNPLSGIYEDDETEAQTVMHASNYPQYIVPPVIAFHTGVNRSMMNVHIRAHAALMELSHAGMVAGYDQNAWGKCVDSAVAVAGIVKEMKYEMSPCLLDVLSWVAACEILVRERDHYEGLDDAGVPEFKFDDQIAWLRGGMALVPGAMNVYDFTTKSNAAA